MLPPKWVSYAVAQELTGVDAGRIGTMVAMGLLAKRLPPWGTSTRPTEIGLALAKHLAAGAKVAEAARAVGVTYNAAKKGFENPAVRWMASELRSGRVVDLDACRPNVDLHEVHRWVFAHGPARQSCSMPLTPAGLVAKKLTRQGGLMVCDEGSRCERCDVLFPTNGNRFCSLTCANRGRYGIQHENRLERLNYIRACHHYVSWRRAVLTKNGRACVWCGETSRLEVDHIVPFISLVERYGLDSCPDEDLSDRLGAAVDLWDISNGRVLCRPCHKTTDTYGARVHTQ